jgi:hypothetical protein
MDVSGYRPGYIRRKIPAIVDRPDISSRYRVTFGVKSSDEVRWRDREIDEDLQSGPKSITPVFGFELWGLTQRLVESRC